MRSILIGLVFALTATQAAADPVHVRGHYRSDGTYVAPHVRSAPDKSPYNNYSTKPNYNPYTGEQGTVDPYRAPSVPAWRPYQPQPQPQPRTPSQPRCPYGTSVC